MTQSIVLNTDQQHAMNQVEFFLRNPRMDAFILCGSAGTGKTTLVARIIERVRSKGVSCMLVAPTGRASRILNTKLDQLLAEDDQLPSVMTLHSAIYYFKEISVDLERESVGQSAIKMRFPIKRDGQTCQLVIVDEASMVGDNQPIGSMMSFGSGRLLSDLVEYINKTVEKTNNKIKLLFVGDLAQLAPVGSSKSPALMPDYLEDQFGFQTQRYELTTVMRQASKSGILEAANRVRAEVFEPTGKKIQIQDNAIDIRNVWIEDAFGMIAHNLKHNHSSVAVVYSNRLALMYNVAVRRLLWGGNGWRSVVPGEKLLVTRNCHELDLCNGDIVILEQAELKPISKVVRLSNRKEVMLRFREVTFVKRTQDEEAKPFLYPGEFAAFR
ncbi:MAG: AAA family ATPase [Nitrincola sp.]|nr:AAA family ATPase [Nitrincola sp.]